MPYEGAIVGRGLDILEGFPTKLYILRSYVDKLGDRKYASMLLTRTLIQSREGPEIMGGHDFAIALAFGLGEEGTGKPVEGIDIFSARLRGGWEGNPIYDSWTFEDGVYVPREKGTTCGTGLVILGKEEELRRGTADLDSFLKGWPYLGGLCGADLSPDAED